MAALDINDRFEEALRAMSETQDSLFITGKAGTGKSTLLAHFCAHTDKKPVVLAPTGVAALNVKGQTIHSFFGFSHDVTPQKIRDKKSKPRNPKLYRKVQTIIIDEISMVRADLLDCVDIFLRMYGPRAMKAFGGVQMIFIGDLYQLPPVVARAESTIFASLYKTPYFFSAHALEAFPLQIIELDKIYRQKDAVFVDLLNKIRTDEVTETDIKLLNSRYRAKASAGADDFYITLTTTNQRADEINETHLAALAGTAHHARAEIKGEFTKEYFPTAFDLAYKIGAQIMMLNNDSAKQWVNGSIGVIEAVKKDAEGAEYLRVRLQDQPGTVEVRPHSWEVSRFGVEGDTLMSEPVGTFTQYPFRLAWAITIHKSQGKTFDHVTIDIGRGAFAAGQIYVALSRCTSLQGIVLQTPIARRHIRTDAQIVAFLPSASNRDAGKISLIESAIRDKGMLDIVYLQGNDIPTARTVRPLTLGPEIHRGTSFIGMKAFCTLRNEERIFSIDRILEARAASDAANSIS